MPQKKTRSDGFRRVANCLYRYDSNGKYYAIVRHQGKLIKKSLETQDLPEARRLLRDFQNGLDRVDVSAGKITLAALCDAYLEGLSQAPKTMRLKHDMVSRLKRDWPVAQGAECQVSDVKPAHVRKWLAIYSFGASAHNAHLWLIRAILDHAVENRFIRENPAASINAKKREKPLRLAPTFEQFLEIVREIRTQKNNARAQHSGDLVEFMGLAGVGNAEAANLEWSHVDFGVGKITLFRQKTRQGYQIPMFPQVRGLLERMHGGEIHDPGEKVFKTRSAKKALASACDRLGLPHFDHRALRRMFVTRALEKGVDVKTVAEWQGHSDGGRLILSTYSHVLREHSDRMAERMTMDE